MPVGLDALYSVEVDKAEGSFSCRDTNAIPSVTDFSFRDLCIHNYIAVGEILRDLLDLLEVQSGITMLD